MGDLSIKCSLDIIVMDVMFNKVMRNEREILLVSLILIKKAEFPVQMLSFKK